LRSRATGVARFKKGEQTRKKENQRYKFVRGKIRKRKLADLPRRMRASLAKRAAASRGQNADTPTRRHADTPIRRHDAPWTRHAGRAGTIAVHSWLFSQTVSHFSEMVLIKLKADSEAAGHGV
jgi:hypothetical protein